MRCSARGVPRSRAPAPAPARHFLRGDRQLTRRPKQRRWDDAQQLVQTGVHYERAPIVEAIIEIRCALPQESTLDDLANMADEEAFPTASKRMIMTGRFDFGPEGVESRASGEQTGHVFRSADDRYLLQSRLDGFSFARTAPYEHWEEFSKVAERHWHRYREVARPERALRVGVRYVNRIDVAGDHVEVKDYLRTAVDVSPYLPQLMSSYFLQIVIPLPQFQCFATVTSTIVGAETVHGNGLILDIDAWRDVDLDLKQTETGTEIEDLLETLRAAKNYVFEASITDATRRLIE